MFTLVPTAQATLVHIIGISEGASYFSQCIIVYSHTGFSKLPMQYLTRSSVLQNAHPIITFYNVPSTYTVKSRALLYGAEWTSSHQCTSWPFCPLDGVHFFIWSQMGFITVHFFLLLTIVFYFLFFLVLGHFPPGPDLPPCSLSYLLNPAPTFVPYLLSPTDIATLITSYAIDLAT